jgi:hypothetical protein
MITEQTRARITLRNSRLYPFIDFLISVPEDSLSNTSSLLFPIAIKSASRNTIMFSHSEIPILAITAPPFTLNTKPMATITISRMGMVFNPKE